MRAAVADGRVARGARTREALAEALISLIEEGDPQPTARRIAERAGVSLRLVFHHFEDVESVLKAAVTVQEQRHWAQLVEVPATLPLAERLAAVVRQRVAVYRAVAPVRRSARLLAHTSPTIAAEVARGRAALRRQLEVTFASELRRLDPGAARTALDALDVALSWETWEQIDRLGRSSAACRRTMATLATGALSAPTTGGGP